jgi:hypothetical protein
MITTIRWIARILGILTVLLVVMILLGKGFAKQAQLTEIEKMMFIFEGVMLIGIFIAFRWEGISSLLILLGYITFATINSQILEMPVFYLFPVTSLLLGFCWLKSRKKSELY